MQAVPAPSAPAVEAIHAGDTRYTPASGTAQLKAAHDATVRLAMSNTETLAARATLLRAACPAGAALLRSHPATAADLVRLPLLDKDTIRDALYFDLFADPSLHLGKSSSAAWAAQGVPFLGIVDAMAVSSADMATAYATYTFNEAFGSSAALVGKRALVAHPGWAC